MALIDVDRGPIVARAFEGDTLRYSGGVIDMQYCSFVDCNWLLAGPAANTLMFLQAMYHGHNGPGGKKLVMSYINRIVEGTLAEIDRDVPR